MKRTKYVVLSSKENPNLAWEEGLTSTLGVCHTFSRAYEIGLFLSGITRPAIKYRKALETCKLRGAVRIDSKLEEPFFVVVKTRVY